MILKIILNSKVEITVFFLTIIISTSMIIISNTIWKSSLEIKNTAKYELDFARDRYHTALNKKRLLLKFEDQYNNLIKSGIVGDEQRLDWIDVLESSVSRFQIPYLKYHIEKISSVKSSNLTQNYAGIDVFKSTMTLEMQLLHEGDLFTVINHLDATAKGLFDIQKCSLIRNPMQSSNLLISTTDRNFSAKCTLNWYTIKEKHNAGLKS
ncbi:hypothetical protein MNBD_GAMMA09-1938 [hydrothermal vent metagenome]|uniref:Uncharacterized protein n=1 Tax=hydrothermal vent metagenome TaxID=652676 RepID=A0A3B0XN73_9ZZZZ